MGLCVERRAAPILEGCELTIKGSQLWEEVTKSVPKCFGSSVSFLLLITQFSRLPLMSTNGGDPRLAWPLLTFSFGAANVTRLSRPRSHMQLEAGKESLEWQVRVRAFEVLCVDLGASVPLNVRGPVSAPSKHSTSDCFSVESKQEEIRSVSPSPPPLFLPPRRLQRTQTPGPWAVWVR